MTVVAQTQARTYTWLLTASNMRMIIKNWRCDFRMRLRAHIENPDEEETVHPHPLASF